MSDLISTQEAVAKIVDTAIRKILSGEQKLTKEYEQTVIEAVNVILNTARCEIVRCNECKYAHITYGGEVKYCDIWFPDESHYMDTDNYCSFAERRTDERSDRQTGGD